MRVSTCMRRVQRSKFLATQEAELGSSVLVKEVDLPDPGEGPDTRTQLFVISSGVVDREGDTLDPKGWDLSEYQRGPIVLFNHDYNQPIGRALDTYLDGIYLKSLGWFMSKDINEFADNVYKMIKARVLTQASVGFLPMEYTPAPGRRSEGPYVQPVDVKRQKLLEWSVTPVPANFEASAVYGNAYSKSIDWALYRAWIEKTLDEKTEGLTPRESLEKTYAATKSLVTPSAAVSKGALPYKKTPLADESTPWDGPKEVAAATVDDLKVMCAWVDPDHADVKQGYKLPHHQAAAPHKMVWAGVRAAMAALFGSRGGVQIPEKDRRAVYNHLAESYRAFGKEPPDYKSLSYVTKSEDNMTVKNKAGKVLSAENMEHLKCAMDSHKAMKDHLQQTMDEHNDHHAAVVASMKSAMDMHDKAYAAMKSMMVSTGHDADGDHDEPDEDDKKVADQDINNPGKTNTTLANTSGTNPTKPQESTSSGVGGKSFGEDVVKALTPAEEDPTKEELEAMVRSALGTVVDEEIEKIKLRNRGQ